MVERKIEALCVASSSLAVGTMNKKELYIQQFIEHQSDFFHKTYGDFWRETLQLASERFADKLMYIEATMSKEEFNKYIKIPLDSGDLTIY